MTKITTTHNDRPIHYDETNDEWQCPAVDVKAKTLSALKTKINDFDAKERKLGTGVVLIKIDGYRFRSSKEIAPKVRATMLDKEATENHAAVWISHLSDGQREKTGIHALALDTPENIAILTEADRIEKQAAADNKRAEKMRADIKRITVDELKAMALEVKPQ